MTERIDDTPEGFRLLGTVDHVLASVAPIYLRDMGPQGLRLGFRVGPQHCNSLGVVHGGTWAMLADVLMGLNVGALTGMTGPTVSMSLDFMGGAQVGQWAEGDARVLRHTPRLGFVDCRFIVEDAVALRASAVFRRKYPPYQDFETLLAG